MKTKNIYRSIIEYFPFLFLACFLFGMASQASAQVPRYYQNTPKNNNGKALTVNMLFGGHGSGADLGDRFGNHMSFGLGMDYITSKDLIFGAQGVISFGNNVEEDVIAVVKNEDGLIFGDGGAIATIDLRQRGMNIDAHFGKLFRLGKEGRSGIRATIGVGLFQHKIRIQDDPQVFISQLNDDYKKGYDRLTNGVGITEFIGYQHLGKLRRINFFAGLELTQAFTKNRRSYNFDTRSADTESRLDLAYGFRIGWLLPFYLGEDSGEIRY